MPEMERWVRQLGTVDGTSPPRHTVRADRLPGTADGIVDLVDTTRRRTVRLSPAPRQEPGAQASGIVSAKHATYPIRRHGSALTER